MSLDPISAALDIGGKLIDRLWPDPTQAAQAKLELMKMAQSGELQEMTAAAGIIQTEAASEHWLAATWRPTVMLIFTALVVAYWLGWTAPNLPEGSVLALLEIVKIGIGGYVVGRSAEKVARAWKAP